MGKNHNVIVRGNKLRIKCSRCKRVRHYTVLSHMRRKTVRCISCGKVEHLTLNRRKHRRESCVIKAIVVVNTTGRIQVNLCNVSQTGVRFIVTRATRTFKINQKITVDYRTLSGKRSIRKARVANIATEYVGAQYTDMLFLT